MTRCQHGAGSSSTVRGGCGATNGVTAHRDGSATSEPPQRGAGGWWRAIRPAVLLVLVGVSLYLLLPSLLAVFGSWRSLSHLDWPFAILALVCEVTSWVCLWAVDRVALHTRAWFPVAAAQLTGTAVGRIVPGGGATATATATAMLRSAGVAEPDEAVAAYGVAAVLQMATTFALPVLALPAILGGAAINHSLQTAAYLGIAVFVALVVAGVAAFASDAPLTVAGRAIQSLLNATVRRRRPVTGLPQRLLGDRDSVRAAVGAQWKTVVWAAAGNTAFDLPGGLPDRLDQPVVDEERDVVRRPFSRVDVKAIDIDGENTQLKTRHGCLDHRTGGHPYPRLHRLLSRCVRRSRRCRSPPTGRARPHSRSSTKRHHAARIAGGHGDSKGKMWVQLWGAEPVEDRR